MAIKLILADLDGTLIDSMPYWSSLPVDSLRAIGKEPPADMDTLRHTRPMWEIAEMFSRLYPELGDSADVFAGWRRYMAGNYATRIERKPCALEMLAGLKATGLPIWLLTATDRDLLGTVLDRLEIAPYLDDIVCERETGASKRTPVPYRYCLERAGLEPRDVFLLEDAMTNIKSAQSLGIRACAFYDASKDSEWAELRQVADIAFDDLTHWQELVDYILALD